jgi:hypothetical protein
MNDGYFLADVWDTVTARHNDFAGMTFFDQHAQLIPSTPFNNDPDPYKLRLSYLNPR